jgi:hypothetical protein
MVGAFVQYSCSINMVYVGIVGTYINLLKHEHLAHQITR